MLKVTKLTKLFLYFPHSSFKIHNILIFVLRVYSKQSSKHIKTIFSDFLRNTGNNFVFWFNDSELTPTRFKT